MIAVACSYAFEDEMLIRLRFLCDGHIVITNEQAGERLAKIMELAKVRNATKAPGTLSGSI